MKFRIAILLLIVSMIAINTACSDSEGETISDNTANKEMNIINVKVQKLLPNDYTEYIKIIGVVKPLYKADLSYETGGTVKEVKIDKGGYVRKGDVIVEMENDVLGANLDAAKAQYKLAKINYEKQEIIFKDKVNSEIQLIESKLNMERALASYNLAKAQYDKTFITSPINGVVDKRFYENGEFVIPGTQIVSVINIKRVKIEVGVPEVYLGEIKTGGSASIFVKQFEDKKFDGKVTFVGASVTTNNRTFPTEILVDNSDQLLKPEIVVEVNLQRAFYEGVFLIPEEVVTRSDKGYTVFIADNNKVEARLIEIIDRSENTVAVKSGLATGENLINVGYQNLVHGQSIKIVN